MGQAKALGSAKRRVLVVAGVLVAFVALVLAAANLFTRRAFEKQALTTGPNGSATPSVPFARVAIPSGPRKLDSYVVTADPRCHNTPVLVIFHGSGETISDWTHAQEFLYRHCASSIVFDPTGSGNSPRPARIGAIQQDAIAAYNFARTRFPGKPIFLLGHSLGNGPMLKAVPHLSVLPAGIIVANTFVSVHDLVPGNASLLARTVVHLIPDWWDNLAAVDRLHVPVLVIHSDKDEVNSVDGAHQVFLACHRPRTQIILYGFAHNAIYQDPTEEWWSGVFSFLATPIKDEPKKRDPRDRLGIHHFRETSLPRAK